MVICFVRPVHPERSGFGCSTSTLASAWRRWRATVSWPQVCGSRPTVGGSLLSEVRELVLVSFVRSFVRIPVGRSIGRSVGQSASRPVSRPSVLFFFPFFFCFPSQLRCNSQYRGGCRISVRGTATDGVLVSTIYIPPYCCCTKVWGLGVCFFVVATPGLERS